MHYALYLMMIGLPFAGWLILSAAGKPIPFFGLELPPLVDKNPDLAGQIKEWHETIGNAGYFLIGLHAAAASSITSSAATTPWYGCCRNGAEKRAKKRAQSGALFCSGADQISTWVPNSITRLSGRLK